MSTGGLSKARLQRMDDVMAGYVARGEVPGVVTLVSRRGEVHVDALGTKAVGGRDPMRRDPIFRIASMTKPITAVATMILVEECTLRLDEPVERLLPELADRKVLKRLDGPLDDTVPAKRPISVRDLLTLRMGFGYIMEPSSAYPIQKAANEQQFLLGPPKPQTLPAPDEWIQRFARLPLMHQPGEKWMYDLGMDVLGVLIARASGQSLETFLRERLFEPLGMKDTGFSVPATKLDRFATSYWTNPDTGALEFFDKAEGGQWSRPPAFPSAGGGLVSTIDDYLAFGQMMLNKGKHGGERVLSRLSVETMTTDQLTPEQR
jgi:CubicO group peptidase (beta-lactamase class C family)